MNKKDKQIIIDMRKSHRPIREIRKYVTVQNSYEIYQFIKEYLNGR